jgi:hypothetical protein
MTASSHPRAAGDAAPKPGQRARSDNLLPADPDDPDLNVAEEVAFDLQSDQARKVGAMPADVTPARPATAIAHTLSPSEEGAGACAPDS